MPVEQFDPSTSNSNKSQTTTLDISSKIIEEQHQAVVDSGVVKGAKVGFVSLG
jgi:ribosomal protein S12 methylthiotransferase